MNILIVDDHKVVRDGVRFMLTDEHEIRKIDEADSAAGMFEIIEKDPVDVVLLDIQMPGISGLEALERLSDEFPQVKVLMLSMYDQPGYVHRAMELGAAGYLSKNAGRKEVLAAITAAAEGQTYIHRELMEPLISSTLR